MQMEINDIDLSHVGFCGSSSMEPVAETRYPCSLVVYRILNAVSVEMAPFLFSLNRHQMNIAYTDFFTTRTRTVT